MISVAFLLAYSTRILNWRLWYTYRCRRRICINAGIPVYTLWSTYSGGSFYGRDQRYGQRDAIAEQGLSPAVQAFHCVVAKDDMVY